jgi:hypothetical protein
MSPVGIEILARGAFVATGAIVRTLLALALVWVVLAAVLLADSCDDFAEDEHAAPAFIGRATL